MEAIYEFDGAGFNAMADRMIEAAATLHVTAFPLIAADFRAASAHRFEVEGPGWSPLAASTVRRKTRKRMPQPSRILFGWGNLAESMAGRGQDAVTHVTVDVLFVGTKVPYAHFHQEGGGRLPRRPIVDVTEADVARWGTIINSQFDLAFARIGPR
jgi:phage gpG-like protein